MESTSQSTGSNRSLTVALAIALGSAAVIVVQELVQFVTGVIVTLAYSDGLYGLAPQLGPIAVETLVPLILLTAGLFLSLWRVAPVTGELRPPRVIVNSLVAAGIGVGLAFLGAAIWLLAFSIPFESSFFGNSFPMSGGAGRAVATALVTAAANAVTTFMNTAPIVVLAGLLAWIRLSVGHREARRSDAPGEV